MKKANKVVLAYSGGLDTSVILKWLCEEYGAEVVAFAADLGQGGLTGAQGHQMHEVRAARRAQQGQVVRVQGRAALAAALPATDAGGDVSFRTQLLLEMLASFG